MGRAIHLAKTIRYRKMNASAAATAHTTMCTHAFDIASLHIHKK